MWTTAKRLRPATCAANRRRSPDPYTRLTRVRSRTGVAVEGRTRPHGLATDNQTAAISAMVETIGGSLRAGFRADRPGFEVVAEWAYPRDARGARS
ncbi:hypothetical protein DFR74_114134 [Nocardia puris]|uniref:Uncharacterized protein n=1 Tax=Nocardia puris TaxID=208602 RepID=A0A366D6B5_9NOCA|nr:hypothetical protein DFR74_114134 [Nocardia puris]